MVKELSKKYEKTPAQILLRWAIQKGISVIPKSTNKKRLAENFNVFDFEINESDQHCLDNVKERTRLLVLDL